MARRYADLPIPTPAPKSARASREPVTIRRAHVVLGGIAAGCLVLPFAARAWQHTELIAPLAPNVESMAIFVGTFAGACLFGAIVMRVLGGNGRPGARGLADGIAGAGLCVFAATWSARLLVEGYGFAGIAPARFLAEFQVVGHEAGSHGARYLRLRFGTAGRVFAVPAAMAAMAAYDAAHPGETVTLPVETDRAGLQRAVLPDRHLDVADLHGA